MPKSAPLRRRFGLRAHLGALVLAALLPALALGGLALWDAADAYRKAAQWRLAADARSVALAVSRDIATQRAIVQALIELPEAIDRPDGLADFESVARRLAATVDGWVVMTDSATNTDLVNTRLPRGQPLQPRPASSPIRQEVERSGQIVIADLFSSPRLGIEVLAVLGPVKADGRVVRVLGLHTTPQRLLPLLSNGTMAEGGVVTVVDGQHRIVARSREMERFLGTRVARNDPSVPTTPRVNRTRNAAGVDVLIATHPVPETPGWVVAVAEPWQQFLALRNDAFLKPFAGVLGTIVLSVLLVLWLAGRILRPVQELAHEAGRHASGTAVAASADPPAAPLSGIREVDTLARSIAEARHALATRASEAENQAALIASVMDAATEPVFAKDLQLRFVSANRAATEVMGGSLEALLGRRVIDIADPAVAPLSEAQDRIVIATGQPWLGEQDVMTLKGRKVFMTNKVPWRDASGQIIGIVAVSRDVTGARRTETRLAAAQARLLQVSRLGATGAMAAGLAHEINQPLTAITNYTSAAVGLLGAAGTPAPVREKLEEVRRVLPAATAQARRAGAILQRLRGFISDGASELRPEPLDEVVRDAASMAAATLAREGTELVLELPELLGVAVIDRVQIQQVLFNLLRNAAEAMRERPVRRVRLSAWRESATGGTAPGEGSIVIEVADTGPGLAEEVEANLFSPFVTTKPDGLGVGLAICRRALEAHGGSLEYAPGAEGGAVFRLTVPDRAWAPFVPVCR